MNGANILRVHDVKEAREAIKLYEAVSAGSQPDWTVQKIKSNLNRLL